MAKGTRKDQAKSGRGKEWNFPRNSLEESIRVAQVIDEKFAGNPTPPDAVTKPLGFNSKEDWRFRNLIISAEKYGLIKRNKDIELTDLAEKLVSPSSPVERQRSLKESFEAVELFKKVSDYYSGKKVPEDEYFKNTVTRQFSVEKDRVDTFTQIFRENLNYLSAFATVSESDSQITAGGDSSENKDHQILPSTNVTNLVAGTRKFLSTCFVMMPFGNWFNEYYEHVYSPAIKEAGLDPIRADEIFITNSVIEQVWEQIRRADVLVAELTGKNPNVFYELGLAHAIAKPIILLAQSLDDVPFDLRHVRIITYDVRHPKWAEHLGVELTKYLKAAKENPVSAVPRMFLTNSESEP
jgi:hypothetical protein